MCAELLARRGFAAQQLPADAQPGPEAQVGVAGVVDRALEIDLGPAFGDGPPRGVLFAVDQPAALGVDEDLIRVPASAGRPPRQQQGRGVGVLGSEGHKVFIEEVGRHDEAVVGVAEVGENRRGGLLAEEPVVVVLPVELPDGRHFHIAFGDGLGAVQPPDHQPHAAARTLPVRITESPGSEHAVVADVVDRAPVADKR